MRTRLATLLCLAAMVLVPSFGLVAPAAAESSIPQTDQNPLTPLPATTASIQPRYISGFGLDNSYTMFYEDRNEPCGSASRIYFNQTTSGPLGFSATGTATNICDTHFTVKNWPITIGAVTYAYRAWGSGTNSGSHNFYGSNDLLNWTLVTTFLFDHPSDGILYGFHDIIQINGHYLGFVESAGASTYIVRSDTGDMNWTVLGKVGGSAVGEGPLNLSFTTGGPIPSGNFLRMEVGGQIVYGKLMIPANRQGAYLAINQAAAQAVTPGEAETAFVNPTNWKWADGTIGLPGTGAAVLTSTFGSGGHTIQETWTAPRSDPHADYVILYAGKYVTKNQVGIGCAAKNAACLVVIPPSTVWVDDDWASKSPGDVVSGHTFGIDAFDTIQKGINAVLSGGTVYVAAGTYTEVGQIVISKNLNIVGASSATTIIKTAQNTGSAGDPRGWFLINTGKTFNLSQVTLDGTGFKVSIGLLFNGGGNIDQVVLTNIQYEPSGPAYKGFGIGVYGPASVVNVTNSTFTQIGRIGIHFRGPGVSGTSSGNRFVGKGVGNWLDYGVEVGAGAHATITNNTFRACLGVVNAQDTSAGILVTTFYGSGTQATITGNTITDSFDGIKVGYDATVDTSTVVAHYNSIVGNLTGIKTSPNTNMVDARYNWWGNASGPGSIGPGTGDKVSVNVNYTPWARALVASTTASTHEVGETGILTTSLTVDGLYGAQLRVTHDATLNWGNGVTITVPTKNWFWQIMTDNFKSVSSPLGIRVAGANQRPEGAANLAGDAIAQWNYTCNTAGTSALTYDTSTGGFGTKLSDINGLEIPAALLGDSITCLAATSAVDGYIGLQGRLKGSVFPTGWLSSTVTLTCTGGTCVGSGPYAMVTNADGYYQRVKTGAGTGIASGTYTAVVTRRGYLPATKALIPVSGGTVTLSALSDPQVPTLLGGDVDGTLGINVNDLSTIGTAFGLVPVGGADTGADVNGDNIVNIFDLVLAGGNYGLSASPTW